MRLKAFLFLVVSFGIIYPGKTQKIYVTGSAELIFSSSNIEFNQNYLGANPEAQVERTNLRYTMFYSDERQVNYDFSKYVGIYSGLGIKNVGMISDELLVLEANEFVPERYKINRRIYTLGVPLAIKIGSLKKRQLIYFGGEYELVLNYKEKYWKGAYDRKGKKIKYNEWFPEQTNLFIPSFFIGYQFSKYTSIKFRYYPENILNHDYADRNPVSDLTRYSKSQMFYFSLVIHPKQEKKKYKEPTETEEVML